MRVNIFQNNVCSIDFDTVDQVIDFIKKFNSSNNITSGIDPIKIDPIKIDPNDWTQPWNPYTYTTSNPKQSRIAYEQIPDLDTYKVADPVPNPYTITANIK